MKSLFRKKRYLFLSVILIFILIPIIVNIIVTTKSPDNVIIAGNQSDWVAFYGNYLGAILGSVIGAAIALIVVFIEQKHRDSEALQEKRLNILMGFTKIYYSMIGTLELLANTVLKITQVNLRKDIDEESINKLCEKYGDIYSSQILMYRQNAVEFTSILIISRILFSSEILYTQYQKQYYEFRDEINTFFRSIDVRLSNAGIDFSIMQKECIEFKDKLDLFHKESKEHILDIEKDINRRC